jgi:hypothetical protein
MYFEKLADVVSALKTPFDLQNKEFRWTPLLQKPVTRRINSTGQKKDDGAGDASRDKKTG